MSIEIVMPKLSDTMEEGTILKWLKQVGDPITAGEVIAEVETDKADMELEAAESGVLTKVQVAAGEKAAVGDVIALVDETGAATAAAPAAGSDAGASRSSRPAMSEDAASGSPEDAGVDDDDAAGEQTPPAAKPVATKAGAAATAKRAEKGEPPPPAKRDRAAAARPRDETAAADASDGDRTAPKASAAARALADERGVDLATVRGSGPAGRIVSEDVEAASAAGQGARSERPRNAAPGRSAPVVERHPLSRMRQSIARRMSEAFREIPHFSVTAEIDMSEAVRLKAALEKHGGFAVPVTYTHMVLKATAQALTRHPHLNASYRDDALEVHAEVNLGMAVAVEDGLIVPVLRRADERSLADIASEARRLVAQAKQGRFASEDLSGGTFTVSNMGMLDLESFTAVINPPQAAILAVGSIKPRPVVRDGAVVAAHTMYVTVSCDHRIIDGVMAGRFLEELKTLLENPIGLVVA